jgi:aquaporin-4
MPGLLGVGECQTRKFWQAVTAELIGTALLITLGCGSCVYDPSVLHVSLAFGVTIATIVWSIAHISGGHINPAVTAAFLATRKISVMRALFYILAQCVGAAGGAALLKTMTPHNAEFPNNATLNPLPGLGAPGFGPGVWWFQALNIESMITFILVLAVFATCDKLRTGGFPGALGPLAIGLSVTVGHLWAVKLTGAATNPAAAFGTALVSGHWETHWVYWAGPINGGIGAAMLYEFLLAVNACPAKLKSFFTECSYDDSNFDEHGRKAAPSRTNDLAKDEPPNTASSKV